jgi:hypothetical protein
MSPPAPRLVTSGPLPYLLSLPADGVSGARPLLCFLHGYDEGAPTPIHPALTRHGPLAPSASARARAEFVVVAAQMPARGDLWHRHTADVREIVRQVRAEHGTDAERTFLTGFSFGGNGVFDLARDGPWAALWPVDPTRVPRTDPGLPVWLSSGEISRHAERDFIQRLRLEPPMGTPGDRVYLDEGQDHVGTARVAYADDRIYGWLLSRVPPNPGP